MKELFKSLIHLFSYIFCYNQSSKVIYYHDLGLDYTNMGTDVFLFKKHLQIISESGYKIVEHINCQKGQVMICFDDGWAGIYKHKNIFISLDVYPTVFIAVDLIGKEGYLSKKQIEELISLGFHFECHTWNHRDLTSVSDEDLIKELSESKQFLKNIFGVKFNDICFPLGRFSKIILLKCKEFKYDKIYSSIPGGYFDFHDKGIICRLCAQYAKPKVFKWMLNSRSIYFRNRYIRQQFVGSFFSL